MPPLSPLGRPPALSTLRSCLRSHSPRPQRDSLPAPGGRPSRLLVCSTLLLSSSGEGMGKYRPQCPNQNPREYDGPNHFGGRLASICSDFRQHYRSPVTSQTLDQELTHGPTECFRDYYLHHYSAKETECPTSITIYFCTPKIWQVFKKNEICTTTNP